VKEYRDKIFLPEMKAIDRLTIRYIEVNNKLEVSHRDLLPGEKRHVVYFHEESCFHAYDFKKGMWSAKDTAERR
jgi:tRNA G37 N-methylase Trm5